MRIIFAFCLLIFVFAQNSYFQVNINKIGYSKLVQVKSLFQEPEFSVEIDDTLLIYANQKTFISRIAETGLEYHLILSNVENSNIQILQHTHMDEVAKLENVQVLVSGKSGFSIVHSSNGSLKSHKKYVPFTPNMVLVRQTENDDFTGFKMAKSPRIEQMVKMVENDSNQWWEQLRKLQSFNRFSYGKQIHNAKDYIIEELKKIGKFNITLESYSLRGTPLFNIIAKLQGNVTDEHYLVCGHMDSISQASGNERLSPGAEDDGSGSIGVLEMARIFAKNPPRQTMYFIFFTGEEQGLVGSQASSTNVVNRGDAGKVKLMLQMDMIGYKSASNPYRVLLETRRTYESLVKQFQDVAKKYCDKLETSVSFNPFGSDHVPYLNKGMRAILTIDSDYGRYPHYHRTTDTIDKLVKKQMLEIIKMNVALLATVLGY